MSEFEPWGVVVSEAIANARPVICSIACGSSADLVVNEMNGYVLESTSTSEISSALVKFHKLKPAQLISMANHSISIATDFGKNDWVSTMQGIERCIS
jgi:glycosyltransferase involved in cell wall biosynthesis